MTILTKRLLQETFNPIAIDGTAYSYVQIGDLGILTEDLHEPINGYIIRNSRYYYPNTILDYDFSNIGLQGWHLPTSDDCVNLISFIRTSRLNLNTPTQKIWRNSDWRQNAGDNLMNLNFGAYGYLDSGNRVILVNEACSYYTKQNYVGLDSFYTSSNFYQYTYPSLDFINAKRLVRLVKNVEWNTESKPLTFRMNALLRSEQ